MILSPPLPVYSKTKIELPSTVSFSSSTISASSIETTTNDRTTYNEDDALRIYQNKLSFFFEDSTMRSMYCDLSQLLHNGKMLNIAEIKKKFHRLLEKINEQFDDKLSLFQSKLFIICSTFKLALSQLMMIWLPSLSSKSLNDKETH
ncbi:unnamed protein product [Rotaria sp. Silwood2]|nr:unnamed protein product [Rotaria sp. Silwood2]